MIIAIPSKGRAGMVTTLAMVKTAADVRVYVPEAERVAYARAYDTTPIIPVPRGVVGITSTRNWMLDHIAKTDGAGRDVLMLDDDAIGFFKFEGGKRGVGVDVSDRFLAHAEIMFELARDVGTNLWGFQVTNDGKTYREYSPFSFVSVIVGNCMGIIDDGQRFDERVRLKEDYDFSLQSLMRHRRVIRNNKYAFFVAHLETAGGCSTYRTREAEREAVEVLRRKWGEEIIKPHHRRTWEIIVRPPLRGI